MAQQITLDTESLRAAGLYANQWLVNHRTESAPLHVGSVIVLDSDCLHGNEAGQLVKAGTLTRDGEPVGVVYVGDRTMRHHKALLDGLNACHCLVVMAD